MPPVPTLLCVPIMVDEVDAALADARAARDLGADIVEFRIDRLFQGEGDADGLRAVLRLCAESALPCVVTCRSAAEGGEYDGDEAARVALYERIGSADVGKKEHPPRYVDLEFAAYERSANLRQKVHLGVAHPNQQRDVTTGLILSAHDFSGRPANLSRLIASMRANEAASVLKFAWRARSLRDNVEAFEVLRERDRPTIALAMGEFGLMSRVLAPKFGGFLTFASLRDTSATAPGQPTVRELLDLYRFRSIGAETRVYGVIGWPLGQSLSPLVHNAGFEAAGFDGVYLPLPVAEGWEPFKATVLSLLDAPWLGWRGASVTIPHKLNLLRLAREDSSRRWSVDPLAERVGAANTLVVNADGSCAVSNTDVRGVVAPACAAFGGGDGLRGRRAVVLGAGGAARAACVGLAEAGMAVVVTARDDAKSARLADELKESRRSGEEVVAAPWAGREGLTADLWVNCTPLGMKGEREGEMAADPAKLVPANNGAVLFDTVYNPGRTAWLSAADDAGLRTVAGLEMFVEQAGAQFEAWTGRAAPSALFRRVVTETLGLTGP